MNHITMYGADWCPDVIRAKHFLNKHRIDFDFIDVDQDRDAAEMIAEVNNGKRIIPTMIVYDQLMINPDNQALSKELGVNEDHRIQFFGADWCPDCRRAKAFLRDNRLNFQFIDVDQHEWATETVETINKGKRIIPTIRINGEAHTNPDNQQLRELLKIEQQVETRVFDAVIIGGGAAGLTTAIYAQRDRFDTLIVEKQQIGGNAFITQKIENYPGFQSISGPGLMAKMEDQAKTYGSVIKTGEEVVAIDFDGKLFTIQTTITEFFGKSVVLATGSTYRKLGIPNESELIGSGIHYCATCDGAFYRDRDIIVIGGGNSALEEGIFLAGFCKSVKIVQHEEAFSASQTLIDKLPEVGNIEVHLNKKPIEFLENEGKFDALKVLNNDSQSEELIKADGVFVFIGLVPNTSTFENMVEVNEEGFVVTSGLAETSVKGIFAAGDCREGAIAQVAAATGEGVLASYGIRNYLK